MINRTKETKEEKLETKRVLKELHAIRAKIQKEEEGMSDEEIVSFREKEMSKILSEAGISLR
jgi:hypothetical protein